MDRYPSLQGVYPIMQAMEVACEQYHHYPPRKIPEPIAFAGDTPEFRKKLHDAVENEDIEEAEALFRGALEAGWERPAVEAFLYEVVAAHFLGYGHALIYQVKIFDLLDRCGWEHAPVLLPSFLVRLINWTREDVLPEWGWFRKRVGEVESQFGTWIERQSEGKHLDWDPNQFLTSLISGKRNDALDALTDALGKGVPLVDLVDVLSEGAAERILRFEIATDRANDIQNGWLAITHIATYINALRSAILRFNQPELFRLFYYGVRFINQGKALDGVASAEVIPEESYSLESDYVHRIEKALISNDPSQAMGLTQSYLRKFEEACLLEEACQDLVFEDYLVRPIVVGHWIKMTVALFEEYRMSKSPNKEKHLLALMRFGATPIRERWISRVSFEAIQFLEHGKVPKDLM